METFDTDISTKALPLGFQDGYTYPQSCKPNPNLLCDAESCSETSLQPKVIRLACHHTYHEQCYIRNGRNCPKCTTFLQTKVGQLTKSFNESILKGTNSSKNRDRQPSQGDDDDDDDNVSCTNSKDPSYYSSQAWQQHVDNTLSSFNVPQPSQHPTSTQQPTPQRPASTQQPTQQRRPASTQHPTPQHPASTRQP